MCRHRLTVNIYTEFPIKLASDAWGQGAEFLILYAQNYGQNMDDGQPNSGVVFSVHSKAEILVSEERHASRYLSFENCSYAAKVSIGGQSSTLATSFKINPDR